MGSPVVYDGEEVTECPACGSNVTIEVGPDRPLSASVVDGLITADEDEQIKITRTCWECGWQEERSVRIESIETTKGDDAAVERAALIADITREAEAIESIEVLEHALAEVRRQQRVGTDRIESHGHHSRGIALSMTDDEALYDVRERTRNPTHASVEDVCELVCKRAQEPRENHQDAHFDGAMAEIVDRYGAETVRTVIHRILVEHYPFRTATVELEMRNVDGVWIGTTAGWFLRELNSEQDS